MQDIPGLTFNACFHTLVGKLWLTNQIPEGILENEETAKPFLAKTMDAIGMISKIKTPEEYKNLYIKGYKDSNGALLYVKLPDCIKDSDSKLCLFMKIGNQKKFYTVEKFGNQFIMCEYTDMKKSTTGFMVEDYEDCLDLYYSLTGTSNEFIS